MLSCKEIAHTFDLSCKLWPRAGQFCKLEIVWAPEKLFLWEVRLSFEIHSLNDIIIVRDSLYSSPNIELLMLVFVAESENSSLERSSLFNWEGLADSVDVFEFGGEIVNIHKFQKFQNIIYPSKVR